MTKRVYDFDLMNAGDERIIRCRVSERDMWLMRLRPLCTKYSDEEKKFKCEPLNIGVRYWADEVKSEK